MKYSSIREESLKLKVWDDYFKWFDTTEIVWNIDFCVKHKQYDLFWTTAPLLWAEAKTGDYDIIAAITQLVLTIGKARTFDKTLPPTFLWALDCKKISFVEYINIQDIFFINDFNRNVTPSNHETKEFKTVYKRIEQILKEKTRTFDYEKDDERLRDFIKNTLSKLWNNAKIRINKNNFLPIYLKWLNIIKPQIDVNWDDLKKNNIFDSDFFLADLFVDDHWTDTITDDKSVKNDLFVTFEESWYKISRENLSSMFDAIIKIKDKRAYEFFWKNYKRPPKKEYQKYIIERRDLIVPQDIRERKWAFFTPRIWVEKSQEYMAEYFWENYQDEYYIRDCAAWTWNLLAWLTNKYNIYASTLDNADVIVMKDMIKNKTINLLENHVFQFDFLNDSFDKLPDSLKEIINDEEKRKKLIIYINPPYAEAATTKTVTWTWENKWWTSIENNTWKKYKDDISKASNELYAQFLIRIYKEIPKCKIANFSTLKNLQWANFSEFRRCFLAKLEKIFLVPWNTFDNVKWNFPIWFFIWNWEVEEKFDWIEADVYDANGEYRWLKEVHCYDNEEWLIWKWYSKYYDNKGEEIWIMNTRWNDFQNQNYIRISTENNHNHTNIITEKNLIQSCIYLTVRHAIKADWLNDRDQFMAPNKDRENDIEFQNDCLMATLFHPQNRIISAINHCNYRIPFKESDVDSKEKFSSDFMYNYIKDRNFSEEAKKVYNAGKILRKYYHSNCKENYNQNASLYEIREYFQWRNESWTLNIKSEDEVYNHLLYNLKVAMYELNLKIIDGIYEYWFLYK